MENINWGPVLGIAIICLVLGGFLAYGFFPRTVNGEGNLDMETIAEAVEQAVTAKNNEIEELKRIITNMEPHSLNETHPEDKESKIDKEIIGATGHVIDEIYLSKSFNDTLSDREIKTLFDGEIEFDGKDYDAEEILTITNFELLANEEDFKGQGYLTIPYGGINYKFVFESNLNATEINEDETLKFNLLGKEVEIIEWDIDEITLIQGKEHEMNEDDVLTIDGKEVKLEMVMDNSIYVVVDGEGEKIEEGSTKKIQGLEFKAKEVLYDSRSDRISMATLIIGDEVEYEISDGEEYEDDSIWEWSIDTNSIGLRLVEEFMNIDEDEEFKALNASGKICLPNSYVCIKYNGIVEENFEEYKFDLDTRKGGNYTRVKGNFIYGINDYDKIYINNSGFGIYDQDLKFISNTSIELGNTKSEITVNGTNRWIQIKDFKVYYDLNESEFDGNNIDNKEDDYVTDYGVMIKNPKDSAEDQEFRIEVPEEKLEATISVY